MAHSTFIRCPADALKWSYRAPLILEEITRSGADIICLEEVDHFADFLQPKLSDLGFEGLFLEKRNSPCLEFQPNNGPDGCALFFRPSKFSLLEKKEVILKKMEGLSNQVALLVRLEIKNTGKTAGSLTRLCVAVTHLKAKKEGVELREVQGKHLLSEMASFAGDEHSIICGDFNAPAVEPVHNYFTDNQAHPQLMLSSSYAGSYYKGEEPPMTSWKFRATGEAKYAIDYIWVRTDKIGVESVWRLPTEEEIGENGLPCAKYPSDHLALCSSVVLYH